jgi:hypothetical protein
LRVIWNKKWNLKFDCNTLINRLKRIIANELSGDPLTKEKIFNTIICGEDSKVRQFFYYEDKWNDKVTDKGDYFSNSGFSNWLDQMLIYAALRKGKEDEALTLEYISEKELKAGKVKFKGDENIRNLAYLNFPKFCKYGAIDSLLLHFIEKKTNDIDQMYKLGVITKTRIHKVMKKTVSLKNLYYDFLLKKGIVMGNNNNTNKPKGKKFRGGYVADPLLNSNTGLRIKV